MSKQAELDEILSDWEFEVFGTPKHWDKTTDRLELDAKRKQAILDWHNKQIEKATDSVEAMVSEIEFKESN